MERFTASSYEDKAWANWPERKPCDFIVDSAGVARAVISRCTYHECIKKGRVVTRGISTYRVWPEPRQSFTFRVHPKDGATRLKKVGHNLRNCRNWGATHLNFAVYSPTRRMVTCTEKGKRLVYRPPVLFPARYWCKNDTLLGFLLLTM